MYTYVVPYYSTGNVLTKLSNNMGHLKKSQKDSEESIQ